MIENMAHEVEVLAHGSESVESLILTR